ncbi:MAG: class I SAM-dependent methyltransferase [Gemmatimonadales bacterium]
MRKNTQLTGAAGVVLGGVLMYFLDPNRGARRRKLVRDQIVHAGRRAGVGLDTTVRSLGNRDAAPARRGAPPARGESARERRDRELFDRVAADHCAKDLHPTARVARKHRLEQTLRAVPVPPGARLLEVGCGAGFSAEYLRGRRIRFCGVDYSERLIAYARAHFARPDTRFEAVNLKDFRDEEGFNVVFMIGVLHHVDEVESAVRQLVALLRPGGWLVVNEPQPANALICAARQVRKRLDRGYSKEQAQLTAAELRAWFRRAGLRRVQVVPQGLLSTPFAEVPMGPPLLTRSLARLACTLDRCVERAAPRLLARVSWNLVAAGQRPRAAAS